MSAQLRPVNLPLDYIQIESVNHPEARAGLFIPRTIYSGSGLWQAWVHKGTSTPTNAPSGSLSAYIPDSSERSSFSRLGLQYYLGHSRASNGSYSQQHLPFLGSQFSVSYVKAIPGLSVLTSTLPDEDDPVKMVDMAARFDLSLDTITCRVQVDWCEPP
ncbi:hypothetical protein V866_000105 [Kwoniella sp. B9012]